MFCPNCGTFIQDGSLACPNCGCEIPIEDSPAQSTLNDEVSSVNNYNSGGYTNSQNYNTSSNYGTVPAKSNTGLIIATIIGVIALILTAFLCSSLVKNASNNKDGTYEYITDYEGESYTFELVIEDGKFDYNLTEPLSLPVYNGTIDFVGNTIQFKPEDDSSFSGTYNKSKNTITLTTEDGETMVFKKIS